eukprot:TRINITY_DN205_c2_g1_i1.p1 TRINITY_DN205_c2_g1~~TRINITY_DN205_c2_g1_i1.p1  ORF type:complete len:447 (-),score=66.39 TRINITY_DN205_c2_g1_i1:114-1454(-)
MTNFFEIYSFIFISLCLVCFFIRRKTSLPSSSRSTENSQFYLFQRNYAAVVLFARACDWIQGPYVYAMYESHGYSKLDIGYIFTAGYSSSAFFGSFVGILADKYGRKRMIMVFGILFISASSTMFSENFRVLMIGRMFHGIATTILYTVFESWMVSEHHFRNFPTHLLSETFSNISFYDAIVAISSGLISSLLVSEFGTISPFLVAIGLMVSLLFVVNFSWNENYGDNSESLRSLLIDSFRIIKNDPNVRLLCIVQTLFESSLLLEIFVWNPTLQEAVGSNNEEMLPLGMIFACFMVAIMIGSSLFVHLLNDRKKSEEQIGTIIFVISLISMTIMALFSHDWRFSTCGLILFEISCGLFWPCFGLLRSKFIPERCRSGVSNLSRIPLNIFVAILLNQVGKSGSTRVFTICSVLLFVGLIIHYTCFDRPTSKVSEQEEVNKKIEDSV